MARMLPRETTSHRHQLKISIRTRRTAGHLLLVAKVGVTRLPQLAERITIVSQLPKEAVKVVVKVADKVADKIAVRAADKVRVKAAA